MSNKPYQVSDEDGNLYLETYGVRGGSYFYDNQTFRCSKCLKFYFMKGHAKRHSLKCNGLFEDGIQEVSSKGTEKETWKLIDGLGSLSRQAQGIDFKMTSEEENKHTNKTTLVFVKNKRPIGIITYCKRDFKDVGDKLSLEDFYVVKYMQKQGIGMQLFTEMLRKLKMDADSLIGVEEKMVVNQPSKDMISFLKGRGLEKMKGW